MTLAFIGVCTVRVSIILAAGLAVARLARGHSASLRHAVLATAVCGALAAPVLGTALPSWHPTWLSTLSTLSTLSEIAPTSPETPATVSVGTTVGLPTRLDSAVTRASAPANATAARLPRLLLWTWIAGALMIALNLVVGLARLRCLSNTTSVVAGGPWLDGLHALESDARLREAVLLQSDHPNVLLTWGIRRPRIVLPRGAEEWSPDRIRVVLEHEAEHIRRGDWVWQLLAETLRAVSWFNPLAWAVATRLRLESERACDDAVLASGVAPSEYAEHLVDLARLLARPHLWVPAPAMARASSLERRVSAMLDSHVSRRPLTRLTRLVLVIVGLAFTASIASFAAQSNFSTFAGTVRDQLGGTIPSVTLTLSHGQTGATHSIKSNGSGTFEFVGLPSGNYTLTIKAMGFKGVERALQFGSGQTIRQDVALEVGTLQETITVRDGPSSSTSQRPFVVSPGSSSACITQPNSGGIKPPTKVHNVKPIYPPAFRGSKTEGRVELQAVIGVNGAVRTIQTVEATNPDFELAAQEAVRDWRFTPTLLNCVPIEVSMNVLTRFAPEPAAPPPPAPPPSPPAPPTPPAAAAPAAPPAPPVPAQAPR